MSRPVRCAGVLCVAVAVALLLGGCKPQPAATTAVARMGHTIRPVATTPAQALELLVEDLRNNDLTAFLAHAVPADRLPALRAAWRAGQTRWPLEELPFAERVPAFVVAFAKPTAERTLQRGFDQRFAGRTRELRGAANTLGVFGERFVAQEAGFAPDERTHFAQCIRAMVGWAQTAPLGDKALAHQAIRTVASAARTTGITGVDDFQRLGLDESLQRLGPFMKAVKQAALGHGLAFDAALDSVEVAVAEQSGNRAVLAMRYTLAGTPIDARVPVRRIDGHWYLVNYVQRADAGIAVPRAAPVKVTPTAPSA